MIEELEGVRRCAVLEGVDPLEVELESDVRPCAIVCRLESLRIPGIEYIAHIYPIRPSLVRVDFFMPELALGCPWMRFQLLAKRIRGGLVLRKSSLLVSSSC
jgi:hypothetical protein